MKPYIEIAEKTKADRIKALIEKTPGKISKKDIAMTCPDISVTTIERTLAELLATVLLRKLE